MDVVIAIIAVLVVGTIFVIVGKVMFRGDQSGARGILRAWGMPDDYVSGDQSDTHDDHDEP